MPRLPDVNQLAPRDPSAAYIPSTLPSESPQAAADNKLGAGLVSLGGAIAGPIRSAVEEYQNKDTQLQEAQANAYLTGQKVTLADKLKDETDPDATKGHADAFRSALDEGSKIITDPKKAELWRLRNAGEATSFGVRAENRAFDIKKDKSNADQIGQINTLTEQASKATDDETRGQIIKNAHGLIDAREAAGYITAAEAARDRISVANGIALQTLAGQAPGERLAALQGWEGKLINRESGGNPASVNKFGYAGLYQMGAPLLSTLGVYTPGSGEDLKNWSGSSKFAEGKWSGTFNIPGYPGVRTLADFKANPDAQQAAFRLSTAYYDKEIAERGLEKYIGKEVGGVQITRPGIYAMMHLGGAGGAQSALVTEGGSDARDANGSSVLSYARMAAGAGGAAVPTGPEGLKLKSGEAVAGGETEPGVFALAHSIQADEDVKHFSAFNDTYHQSKSNNSAHKRGLAFDLTPSDPTEAPSIVQNITGKLTAAGLKAGTDFQVVDEYANPSANATGGHVHVEFKSADAAKKYATSQQGDQNGASPLVKFLTPQQRQQLVDRTKQDLVNQGRSAQLAERAESATVNGLIKDDENSIMTTGRPVTELTPERVEAARGPEAAAAFARNRAQAAAYHEQTNDFENIPSAEIQSRVQSLAPKAGQAGFTEDQAWYETASKKAQGIIKLRRDDPAAAVDSQPDVAAARANATLDQPEGFRAVAKARMQAQERIGISEDLRTPITREEARNLYKPISMAAPEDQLEVLRDTVKQINTAFGEDADNVLQAVLKEGHADKAVRETTAAVVRKLARGELPSQTEARAVDEAAKTAATDRAVAPIGWDSTAGVALYSPADEVSGPPAPPPVRYPSPSEQALKLLRENPALADKFDQRYGAGKAKAALGAMGAR